MMRSGATENCAKIVRYYVILCDIIRKICDIFLVYRLSYGTWENFGIQHKKYPKLSGGTKPATAVLQNLRNHFTDVLRWIVMKSATESSDCQQTPWSNPTRATLPGAKKGRGTDGTSFPVWYLGVAFEGGNIFKSMQRLRDRMRSCAAMR